MYNFHKLNKAENRELFLLDLFFFISIFMALSIRFMTLLYLGKIQNVTKANIEDVVTTLESNPIARASFNFGSMGRILGYIMIPGFMGGVYWTMRRGVIQGDKVDGLHLYVWSMFFILLHNFVNDLALMLSRLGG